jgi:hypothetical protein
MVECKYSSAVLDLGTRWRWAVSVTPSRFTSCTHWVGGCVGPRASLEAVEMRKISFLCPATKSLPSCPQPLPIPAELFQHPNSSEKRFRNRAKINQKPVFRHHCGPRNLHSRSNLISQTHIWLLLIQSASEARISQWWLQILLSSVVGPIPYFSLNITS